jgi:hypothetical protein
MQTFAAKGEVVALHRRGLQSSIHHLASRFRKFH